MLRYLESELPQGSQEWLELRKGHITATMASVIAGNNPFQNPDKLWKEMLGIIPRQSSNFAMERGKRLEPIARERYQKLTGEIYEPMCVVSELEVDVDGKFWVMASLDGIEAFGLKGLEIKCPGLKAHMLALEGKIHDYYMDQMQWQFLAAENKFHSIDYVSYNPDLPPGQDFVVINVLPDLARQKELKDLAQTFRNCLKNKVPPCGSEFEAAAKMFVIANVEFDKAKDKLDETKQLVLKAANGTSQNGSGVIVSVAARKGTVNMESVIEKLMAEFSIPEDRIAAIKLECTGESKSVTSIKAANDAMRVYQEAIAERDGIFNSAMPDVMNLDEARAPESAVSPTW